jgi:predicted negative regulator of RcsB-dependent stress response
MAGRTTPWLELLAPLRHKLQGREGGQKPGSLRWLEATVAARGGRPGAVRNILYKDLGSVEEKNRLFDILCDLYRQANLPLPEPPPALKAGRARRLLDRNKRAIFARFMRELRAGQVPRHVVVGAPATGKGVLLDELREAIQGHLFVNLARDLAPALYALAGALGVGSAFERLVAQLSPTQPYALQAALQHEVRALLRDALNRKQRTLLLRAESEATLGGVALRGDDGGMLSLPHWLEPLLASLEIPFLAALSSPPATLPYSTLRPPSREEARRYLRRRLPHLSTERLESLLNQAGRHYGELSRLALLELSRSGLGDAPLARDPRLGPLLRALAALSPESDPVIPKALLEHVLERPLSALSSAEQALLEPAGADAVRPGLRTLLPEVDNAPEVHARALAYYRDTPHAFRRLYHARGARAHTELLDLLAADPARLALLPGLWREAQTWPADARERLAKIVVRYRATLGDYGHPEAQEALALLAASQEAEARAWANVKRAEAHIDAGRYREAERLVASLEPLDDETRAEAHLVQAALARWHGAYAEAEEAVKAALTLPIPPLLQDRAHLWQGLVAKDAGRFEEALSALAKVRHHPQLRGRAAYQQGDLHTRLGDPERGARWLRQALQELETAPAEERARVQARYGTALRRLGRLEEAAAALYEALEQAPDAFTKARIASEASIAEAARQHPQEALALAAEAEVYFRRCRVRPEEAAYRHRRTLYRLAVAYWVLETGNPYLPPFSGGRQSSQSLALLTQLSAQASPVVPYADRDAALYTDVLLLSALQLPPDEALERLSYPVKAGYLQLPLALARVEAQLRAKRPSEAATTLATLRHLPPDPGWQSWKAALEAELLLALGEKEAACAAIEGASDVPAVFRRQLGVVWGRALLAYGEAALANAWRPNTAALALPEALALRFAASMASGEKGGAGAS